MKMPRGLLISLLVNIWMVELSVSISPCLEQLAAVIVVAVEAAEEVVAASVIEVVAVEEETAVVEAEEVALAVASEAVVDLEEVLLLSTTTLAARSFEQNSRFTLGVKQTRTDND